MGKDTPYLALSETLSSVSRDISRAKFQECVEAGIRNSRSAPTLIDGSLSDDEVAQLRKLAAETDKADALTWKIQDSCGCPVACLPTWVQITQKDLLTLYGEEYWCRQDLRFFTDDDLPDQYQLFAQGYDKAIMDALRLDPMDNVGVKLTIIG